MESRRTDLTIFYEGKDISIDLKPYVKSFSYTDPASGEADRISLGIADFDNKWLNTWFPEKTDQLSASILVTNWRRNGDEWRLNCGSFTVDNVSFDGPPVSLNLEAISTPAAQSFNCRQNTKTWEKTTIQKVAAKVAADAGIGLVYEGSEVAIKILEQSEETDMAFLKKLCDDYGLAMKVYTNKLIIFDEEIYEARTSVSTITQMDVMNWNANTTLTGTAGKATIKYRDPKTGKDATYTCTSSKPGLGGRTVEINTKADSLADAKMKAKAELRKANRSETTMSFTMDAHEGIVAAQCVDVSGFGRFDGKYYVDAVTHSLDGGYTMKLEVRRVG